VATLSQIIDKVRRRVADFGEDRLFEDGYYEDAIDFALQKLNTDFGTTYAAVTDVPANKVFLIVKLATIEMCHMRASQSLEDEESGSSGDAPDFTRVQVPDLHVEYPVSASESTADVWLKLARDLQDEYDGEIKQQGGQAIVAEIQTGIVKKISLTTGGWKRRVLDDGPDAVVLSEDVDGNNVDLAWTPLYDETFSRYDIYRGALAAMFDEVLITSIVDNHTVEYTDEDLVVGTYYYRLKTVDRNELSANSNIVSSTVS